VANKNGRTDTPLPTKASELHWEDVYAELRNKLRWAIGSTLAETGAISLPFRAQSHLAGVLSQDILELLKEIYEKPDLRVDGDNARALLKR